MLSHTGFAAPKVFRKEDEEAEEEGKETGAEEGEGAVGEDVEMEAAGEDEQGAAAPPPPRRHRGWPARRWKRWCGWRARPRRRL